MFRKSPRKDSSWRVYENPDAATYARPDPPQWARTRGEEGPEAYLRNAEKAKSHPFPRSGRPSPDQPKRGLSQAEEYCAAHTDAGADYLQAAAPRHPADLPCCGFPAPPHGQKGRRQKRKRQKKHPQKNTPAQQAGFPPVKRQSQMKVENFIPALFIQLHEVTREKSIRGLGGNITRHPLGKHHIHQLLFQGP